MTKVLAADIGYGDVKVVYAENNNIQKMFKFPSVIAEVKLNANVTDKRVVSYRDRSFYVGKDALNVESSAIIDIKDYALLEYFSPLFLYHALESIQVIPDVIVLGLSIAQINNSGHYKANIEDFLRKAGLSIAQVIIVPQGAIAKLAVDKYGVEFPQNTKDFSPESSYILADIGFNTLDVCHVINGSTSSNLIRGIEGRGATLIVQDVIVDIQKQHNIILNMSEGKSVLDTGVLKRRGVTFQVLDIIKVARETYINNLKTIIENEFGKILDKVDNLVVLGGGAYILNPGNTGFVKSPPQSSEYYNAIGMAIYPSK